MTYLIFIIIYSHYINIISRYKHIFIISRDTCASFSAHFTDTFSSNIAFFFKKKQVEWQEGENEKEDKNGEKKYG